MFIKQDCVLVWGQGGKPARSAGAKSKKADPYAAAAEARCVFPHTEEMTNPA